MAKKKSVRTPRERWIEVTGRPPRTRDEYIEATGRPPSWASWPEDLREKIKLNVRVVPSRVAQVRALALHLHKTMEEVIVLALEALQRDLDEGDATRASEREIMVAVKKTPPKE